jgi:hypothetical protein
MVGEARILLSQHSAAPATTPLGWSARFIWLLTSLPFALAWHSPNTGRDYHSVAALKKSIEQMAMNKLSVFHWYGARFYAPAWRGGGASVLHAVLGFPLVRCPVFMTWFWRMLLGSHVLLHVIN